MTAGIEQLYDFAVKSDSFRCEDEKRAICARFAYLAWSCCRRLGNFAQMREWEHRCEQATMGQESIRSFFALSSFERSEELIGRFLSEPDTMVVACRRLAVGMNSNPAESLAFSTAAYRWATAAPPFEHLDERAHFAGELAYVAATALRHLGRFSESSSWAAKAAAWFEKTTTPQAWLGRLEFLMAAALFDQHRAEEALKRIPAIASTLDEFGLRDELQRCRFLEAVALKDIGRHGDSLKCLQRLSEVLDEQRDPLLLGLVLANIGEIRAAHGRPAEAVPLLLQARALLQGADTPWAIAFLQAVWGQVFRDLGKFDQAIEAYALAAEICCELGMEVRVAYFRLLLAETQILASRDAQAIDSILSALPIFEREALVPDALVAVALLRESIRRQKADPDALRTLRMQLQRMREGDR